MTDSSTTTGSNSNDDDDDVILRVFCIGDFGQSNELLAGHMNNYAVSQGKPPDCILGLGDNFYPMGVESIDDEAFNTRWKQTFLQYPTLCCPWHLVLGNSYYPHVVEYIIFCIHMYIHFHYSSYCLSTTGSTSKLL
jgi:hypothetical protein